MIHGVSFLEEIPGQNPNTFARNLYTEMYDGRMDVVITDTGRRPANSTRVPASLGNVRVLKSNFDLKKAYSIYKTLKNIIKFPERMH